MRTSTRLVPIGLLLVFLACRPTMAAAQGSLRVRTNHYTVTGTSLQELRQSLNQLRPQGDDGRHDGLTTWTIDWKISVQGTRDACRLVAFTTRTGITITLPRWNAPSNAPPELMTAWEKYSHALCGHEQGHVQLVRATVAELHARARTVPPGSDAPSLRQQVDALSREILATGEQRHRDYDALTRHGETQGVRLGGEVPPLQVESGLESGNGGGGKPGPSAR